MKFEMPKINVLTFNMNESIALMDEENISKGSKNDSTVF